MVDEPSAATGTVMRAGTGRVSAAEPTCRDLEVLPNDTALWRVCRLTARRHAVATHGRAWPAR
jgi:hypothetical protein